MLILDSDHLRALRTEGTAGKRLEDKLLAAGREVVTIIINVHEGIKGWLDEINSARNTQGKVEGYASLQGLLDYFVDWTVLPFDSEAADRFDRLRRNPDLRIVQTMDLQIAAVALCHNATVLTRNLAHFGRVPNLNVEDWLLDNPVETQDW